MINWRHRAESLIKEGLNENGRGEIEESEYRQLLGAASLQRGTEKCMREVTAHGEMMGMIHQGRKTEDTREGTES